MRFQITEKFWLEVKKLVDKLDRFRVFYECGDGPIGSAVNVFKLDKKHKSFLYGDDVLRIIKHIVDYLETYYDVNVLRNSFSYEIESRRIEITFSYTDEGGGVITEWIMFTRIR